MRLNRRKIRHVRGETLINAEMHDKVITRQGDIVVMHMNIKNLEDKYSYYLGMTKEEAIELRNQLDAALIDANVE